VTPPAGSRDDDADSAPHREAAPGRADAPDRPGDDERDPQLRAMRAVWLTMRDEDPPDRGLADLLAAARHQAEAMQPRPSAWQQLLAALRRPPVLAFATVTVLIAGAVMIGVRVPREAAPDTRTMPPTPTAPASAMPPTPTAPASAMPLTPTAPASAMPPAAGPATADPAGAAPAREAPPTPPPGAPSPAAAAPPGRPRSVRPPARTATPTPPAPPSPSPSPSDDAIGADEDRAAAGSSPEPPAPAVHQAAADKAAGRGTFSEAPGDDSGAGGSGEAAPARPPREEPKAAPAAADLYQQCEAAARRSDCATVRRIVRRITRTDPGYRARIPGDSPVARCLTR
jgi:hypothetical protein